MRRKISIFLVIFTVLCISFLSFSDEIILTHDKEEVKATIEEPLNFSFNLPPFKSVKLYFLARASDETLEKPAGYADALIIEINGKKILDPCKLINKSPTFKIKGRQDKEMNWFQNNTFLIPISPDYTSVDKHYFYSIENTKACEYIFDITDYVKQGENILKLIRLARPWSKIPLYFKNVKIIYEKGEEVKTSSVNESISSETSFPIAKNVKITAEELIKLSLPVKKEGETIFVKVTCRRDAEKLGGYGHYMQLFINDKFVDASIDRRITRLKNKSLSFKRVGRDQEVFWNLGDGMWLTFFAPNFNTDVSMYAIINEPFTYVLDVTDLLEKEGVNILTVKNLYSKIKEEEYKKELPIYLDIDVIIKKNGDKTFLSSEKLYLDLSQPPELEIFKSGGIKLKFRNNKSILLESLFSFPGGGFNYLSSTKPAECEKEWNLQYNQDGPSQGTIIGRGKYYEIKRSVSVNQFRVLIEDTITNTAESDIGIIFSNYLNFKDLPIYYVRMAGSTSQSINYINKPQNPTLFFPLQNCGIGIVANDNVYRNHGLLFYDLEKRMSGIEDRNFVLPANGSYKISWAVYFTKTDDYYDFINLVRKDWGANEITIEGPVYFVNYNSIINSEEEGLKKLIENKNAKYIAFWEVRTPEPVPEYDNKKVVAMGVGTMHPLFKDEVEKVRRAVDKLKKIKSSIKIALYTHCFFISPEKPDDPTFRDSWIITKDGKRAVSQYNNPTYYNYQPVFPTLNNSYGKAYAQFIDWYLNDIGFDWIYWDESTGPGILGETDKTYNIWDGHSAIINSETKTIEKKYAILGLITNDFIMSMYEKVKRKDGHILFNGAAVTKERIHLPSFIETQDLILRAYESHLNTPLAYGFGKPSMQTLIDRLNYGTIYARTHLDYTSDVVTRFYPITIEEIHSGWVQGKERIITARNGEFGWDGVYNAIIYLYNAKGECIDKSTPKTYKGKIKIQIPEGGIAIIEKIE